MQTLPPYLFAAIAFLMFIVGVGQALLRDVMAVRGFNCPIHWVWMTQVSYSFAFIADLPRKKSSKADEETPPEETPQAPRRIYFIAMLLDTLCMICAYEALSSLSAALVQMMRGMKLIFTFFVSTAIMNQRQLPRQKLGVLIVLVGLTAVVLGSFSGGHSTQSMSKLDGKHGGKARAIAFLLCFFSEVFNAAYYLFQEFVARKYDIPAYQFVSEMGKFGTVTMTIVLVIVNFAPANENTIEAFNQIRHSWPLILSCISYILMLTIFEISGVTVSKQGSAILRALIDVSRGALIWAVELAAHWIQFKLMHGIGFAIIVYGIFVNTGMLRVPFLTLNETEAEPLNAQTSAPSDMAAGKGKLDGRRKSF